MKDDCMSFCVTSELQSTDLAFCLINSHGPSEMPLYPPIPFHYFFPLKKTPQTVNVLTHWNDGHTKGKNDGYKEVKEFHFKKIAKCLNL